MHLEISLSLSLPLPPSNVPRSIEITPRSCRTSALLPDHLTGVNSVLGILEASPTSRNTNLTYAHYSSQVSQLSLSLSLRVVHHHRSTFILVV